MLELILVRHGPTALNEAGRYQGWTDPPLGRRGAERVGATGGVLREAGWRPHRVWSSDLERARTTAHLLAGVLEVEEPVRLTPGLRELSFGVFEGATYRENRRRHGRVFEDWLADPSGVRPPGGETLVELRDRLDVVLRMLPDRGSVLLVTHGGPLRVLLSRILGLGDGPERALGNVAAPAPGCFVRTVLERPSDLGRGDREATARGAGHGGPGESGG